MTSLIRGARFAALGLVLVATAAHAQKDSAMPKQGRCTAAAEVVTHAQDSRVVSKSFGTLLRCANAGAVFADMWASPPTDPDQLARLRVYSSDVADRRILLAALALAQRAETIPSVRRAALDVVLSQYKPTVAVNSSTWDDPEHASLAFRSDYFQVVGAVPITEADRAAVVAAFRMMAQAEATTQWGRVAKRIASDIATTP